MKPLICSAALLISAYAAPAFAQSRDQIRIVGSSTVFPYTQAVAEQFASQTGMKAPVVESTGTGGGMKIFCEGVGPNTPDITGASRAMKASEHEECVANGVDDVTEMLIGYDGLSIAQSVDETDFDLTKAQIFLALASEVPVDGQIVANPNKNWSEIDASLPDEPIQVFGPPPTSGTRDAFVELVMLEGCAGLPEIEALDETRHEEVCSRMRQDGPFIEAGENDNLIVQRLQAELARAWHLRLLVPLREQRHAEGGGGGRRRAGRGDDRLGRVRHRPPAVHLYQECAPRRNPGARRFRRGVRIG